MSHTFDELSDFTRNQMRMSHVYQPVMSVELLKRVGSAITRDIAKALLVGGISQIEHYERITKNIPGCFLTTNRGIIGKQRDSYHLKGFDDLSKPEVEEVFGLCADKHKSFVERRRDRIWSHRKKPLVYISGTL
jgi:ATP adenylyltransferase